MRNLRFIAVGVLLTVVFSVSVFAQTAQTNKVFVIDTGAFADEKAGIKKFIDASKRIEAEFKPRFDELDALAKKYQDTGKQYQTLRGQYEKDPNGPVTAKAVQDKADEAGKLEIDYKRKEEDLKLAISQKEQAVLNPIRVDIYKAMDKFAKEKGYPIIFDLVRLVQNNIILAIGDAKVDVTDEFIAYYNALPGGTAEK